MKNYRLFGVAVLVTLAGCNGCSEPTPAITVGGTVDGLRGQGLVLQNAGANLPIEADGSFSFPQALGPDVAYDVTVLTQPTSPSQTCNVEAGSGTTGAAPVDTVRVRCVTDTFLLGGTSMGLRGSGLVLTTAAGDRLPVTSAGPFTFATRVASGTAFTVLVETQPSEPTQTCTVSGGTGTVGAGDVSSIAVNCLTDSFTLGGTAAGLLGTVVLQNNGGSDLTVTANGTFAFGAPLASGEQYEVTVKTQPASPSQTCVLARATGAVGATNVTDVTLTCTTNAFTIGGAVTGLTGAGLVLQLDGSENLSVAGDGPFAFPMPVLSGAAYAVTVLTQPTAPSQTCTVTGGTGAVTGMAVTTVAVTCVTNTFNVSGSVSGLSGAGLVLRNNAGDDLPITADGNFSFATRVPSGAAYAVTVFAQPTQPSQTCVVTNDSGTVGGSDVSNVAVACTTNQYTVSGTVSGLLGGGLVLSNNGADPISISADGAFTFPLRGNSGSTYSVSVTTQPSTPTQTCTLAGATGTLVAADVTSVAVNCTTDRFSVGGTVSGLASTATLQLNGGNDLVLSANGTFAFSTPLASGTAYVVTVSTQPTLPTQTCVLTNESGSVSAGPVSNVAVSCTTNSYSITGAVTGLVGSGLVLQNNLGVDLAVSQAGNFSFPDRVSSGGAYSVTVKSQPTSPWQTCTVSNGAGTVGGADVTTVTVACTTDTYTVGGTLANLAGSGLVLQNNLGDDLVVPANGAFTFTTSLSSGAAYAVTVKTQPTTPSQTCTVSSDSGTVAGANVTSVAVSCTTNTYSVGGTVTGLSGSGLVLQNSAGDDLAIATNGSFTFTTPVASGATYAVTVLAQPTAPSQTCTVSAAGGTVGGGNVNDVAVSCTTNTYSVGGTVTGLSGSGLTLQNNAGDDLTITANGSFTFTSPVASGTTYVVSVLAQPTAPSQTCTISGGSGTMGGGNVNDVSVSCTTNTYSVGGTVSGLSGAGLVLRNSGGDDLTISANGSFTFTTPVTSGAPYAVTAFTQPSSPSQTCVISNGGGTVGGGNVTDVAVSCTTNNYSIGGTVSGLSGSGLVLRNNGGNDLNISANGSFTFTTPVASGATYAVTAFTQPTSPSQTCVISNGSGTVGGGDVTTVAVSCTTNTYSIGGTVSGLSGTGLVLRNNGGNDLNIAANGSFTFTTPVASGGTYAVTALGQPSSPSQTCVISSGSGTVGSTNVTTVAVSCTTNSFSIGGTVSGLSGSGLVLRNNGGDDLNITANGAFTFTAPVASGATYAVTALTQPSSPSQTCTVSSGSGTVGGGNVTNVTLNCTTNPYTVGGTVTGLAGSGLVLTNNGGDNRTITANGTYTFAATLSSGQTYAVAVLAQPTSPWQTCAVANSSGTVGGANVTNVNITCTTNTYPVNGSVSGLAGSGLSLRNNSNGNNLALNANGSFSFSAEVASGQPYQVVVTSNPTTPWQTCTVSNDSGTVTNAPPPTILVSCATNSYNVNATVVGLTGSGLVIQNNGGQDKSITSNGPVSFTAQLSGSTYDITVRTQPTGPVQTCFVAAGSGTVAGADIAASVVCSPKSCQELKTISPSQPDGIYFLDSDGAGAQAAYQAYCDMTTNGGGWTLLAWTANSSTAPFGVPYPGLAPCAALNCARGSGVPSGQLNALFAVSTEFAKAQSVSTLLKSTYGLLGSYQYAGKYTYSSLVGVTTSYALTSCTATGGKQGTYTGLVPAGATAVVYMDKNLAYGSYNYSSDSNTYIWNVGVPNAYCSGDGAMPGSWAGTWSTRQWGPGEANAAGSSSFWVR